MKVVWEGLRSLWYWLPVIWHDREFDYRYTLMVLEHSLRRQHKFMSGPHCVSLQHESHMRRLHVCILLLERLRGSYHSKARKVEPRKVLECADWHADWNRDDCKYLEKQDWQYLWYLVEKYMQCWWD